MIETQTRITSLAVNIALLLSLTLLYSCIRKQPPKGSSLTYGIV